MICLFYPKMVHNSIATVLHGSLKTTCLGNIWFFSCDLKCSQRIRLHYSLFISGRNQPISQNFCMEVIIEEKQHLKLTLLVRCGQLCFSSNQIAGFFDHQYLQEELVDFLEFLHGDNHHERQHLSVPLLVGCGQVYLLSSQIVGFFEHQYLWEESISLLDFLNGDNYQRKVASENDTFGWVWPVFSPV